ncbi:MAG: hypothetical protein ACRDL7_13110, partial [Gaiellaceae bacterium]
GEREFVARSGAPSTVNSACGPIVGESSFVRLFRQVHLPTVNTIVHGCDDLSRVATVLEKSSKWRELCVERIIQ